MTSPGWTKKPCHGCGSTELHRKDKLCPGCQRVFDDGLLSRKKQDLQLEQGKIMVKHELRFHLIASPYLFEHSGNFIGRQLNDRLRHAWHALTIAVIEPATGKKDHNAPYLVMNKKDTWGVENDFYGYHDDEFFLTVPHIRDSLNELDSSIRLALEYVYLAGKKQGLNILTGLNEGVVALSNYAEEIKRVEDKLNQIGEQVKERD